MLSLQITCLDILACVICKWYRCFRIF